MNPRARRRARGAVGGTALVLGLTACDSDGGRRPSPPAASAAPSTIPAAAPPAPALPRAAKPLVADGPHVDLSAGGALAAHAVVPVGAATTRPTVVVLDAGSSSTDACRALGEITRHPFFLCLVARPPAGTDGQGAPVPFSDALVVRGEVRGALRALKQKFPEHVGPSAVLIGRGAGADAAVTIALDEPAFFSKLVLVEGGFRAWSAGIATRFADGGGAGVVWLCESAACRAAAERNVAVSRGRNLIAYLDSVPAKASLGQIADAVRGRWPALTDDDPWWSGEGRAPAAPSGLGAAPAASAP